jgi:hypothetical protein
MIERSAIEFIIKSKEFTDDEKVHMLCVKTRQVEMLNSGLVRRILDEVNGTVTKEQEQPKEIKMAKARDMYGNEIQAGDYICYPCRRGSDMYMRTAKVIGVTTKKNHLDKDVTTLQVAVAIAPRWSEWEGKGTPNTRIRRTTVACPYRATIIPKPYVQRDPRYAVLANA